MAHTNIDERRSFVEQLMKDGLPDTEIKRIATPIFDCSKAAIHSDLIYFRNYKDGGISYHANKNKKKYIQERDNFTCQYCGCSNSQTAYIIEHIIPAALGGKATLDNLVLACCKCNLQKSRSIWVPKNIAQIANEKLQEYIVINAVKDCR